jgi:hypothetical protein
VGDYDTLLIWPFAIVSLLIFKVILFMFCVSSSGCDVFC